MANKREQLEKLLSTVRGGAKVDEDLGLDIEPSEALVHYTPMDTLGYGEGYIEVDEDKEKEEEKEEPIIGDSKAEKEAAEDLFQSPGRSMDSRAEMMAVEAPETKEESDSLKAAGQVGESLAKVAQDVEGSDIKKISSTPDAGEEPFTGTRDELLAKYRKLIEDAETPTEGPKGPHWASILADSLAGLYNVSTLGKRLKPMQLNAIKTDLAMQEAGIKRKEKDYERKKSAYEQYMKFLGGDVKPMSPYEKARLDLTKEQLEEKKEGRELRERKFEQDQRVLLAKTMSKPQKIAEKLDTIDKHLGHKLDDLEVVGTNVKKDGKVIDLPGISVPGLGRITAHSPESRKLSTAMEGVFNITLKDRSGAAVTTPELERLKKEFAEGRFNTEGEMIQALKDFKSELYKEMRSREAAVDPVVLDRYKELGGRTSDQSSKEDKRDSKIQKFADENDISYERAQAVLKKRGYNG